MTTIAIDLKAGVASSDSWNSPDGGSPVMCTKMWKLTNGDMFFESGHLRPIELALQWAESRWAPAERSEEWEEVSTDSEKYGFACVLVQTDGKVQYLDEECSPIYVLVDCLTLGSGGSYARGAMDAGASTAEAITIASRYDSCTGGPVQTTLLPFKRKAPG